jgi:hypothetical protein
MSVFSWFGLFGNAAALMFPHGTQRCFRQQAGFEVAQPEIGAETVAANRLNTAEFAVGVGIVNCAVDKI